MIMTDQSHYLNFSISQLETKKKYNLLIYNVLALNQKYIQTLILQRQVSFEPMLTKYACDPK